MRKPINIAVILFVLLLSNTAFAVAANTLITNVATVDYNVEGQSFSEMSNEVSFYVDEIVVFSLVSDNPTAVLATSPELQTVLSYTLTNLGNGPETFVLSSSQVVSDDFDTNNELVYIDSNQNGVFDFGTDAQYSAGSNDPNLLSGNNIRIFIVSDVPAGQPSLDISSHDLTATSTTGPGPVGSIYPGAGEGGVDAVMGPQGGFIVVRGSLEVSNTTTQLSKAQEVVDPDGGSLAVTDAIITYTLTLEVVGAGAVSNVSISDQIPAGTTYIPSTLQLDGQQLTDGVDADEGKFDGSQISVDLASVAAPSTKTVQFSVKVL